MVECRCQLDIDQTRLCLQAEIKVKDLGLIECSLLADWARKILWEKPKRSGRSSVCSQHLERETRCKRLCYQSSCYWTFIQEYLSKEEQLQVKWLKFTQGSRQSEGHSEGSVGKFTAPVEGQSQLPDLAVSGYMPVIFFSGTLSNKSNWTVCREITVFLIFLSWKLISAGCGHCQRQRNNSVYCVSKYDRFKDLKNHLFISSGTRAYFF